MVIYPTKKLGRVCDIFADGDWIETKDQSSFGIRLIQTGNVGKGVFLNKESKSRYISEQTLKRLNCTEIFPGDILISRLPDPVGRACIIPDIGEKMITAVDCTIVRTNKKQLLQKFLLFYTGSPDYNTQINKHLSGTTRKRISKGNLATIEIPLPPIGEQRKIVAKLESVLGKISKAKKLRAEARENTDNLLSAELHKIFERGKNKGWEEKEIGEITDEVGSGFACGKQNEVANGVVHLRTHNIDTEGSLNFDKITQIPNNLVVENAFGLEKGDILFNNTNSTELVGKTALITKRLPHAFSNHLTRIKVNKNKVLPEWIVYVFNTLWKDKYFESICTRWVGQSGINQTALKKIKIPLPSLAEQKKIVARLDSLSEKIEKIKNLQSSTQNDFIALEQSILSKAFI